MTRKNDATTKGFFLTGVEFLTEYWLTFWRILGEHKWFLLILIPIYFADPEGFFFILALLWTFFLGMTTERFDYE